MVSIYLIPLVVIIEIVPLDGTGRIMVLEKGRTHLYISRKLISDHAWPFEKGEQVRILLDPRKKRMVVEKLPAAESVRKPDRGRSNGKERPPRP